MYDRTFKRFRSQKALPHIYFLIKFWSFTLHTNNFKLILNLIHYSHLHIILNLNTFYKESYCLTFRSTHITIKYLNILLYLIFLAKCTNAFTCEFSSLNLSRSNLNALSFSYIFFVFIHRSMNDSNSNFNSITLSFTSYILSYVYNSFSLFFWKFRY